MTYPYPFISSLNKILYVYWKLRYIKIPFLFINIFCIKNACRNKWCVGYEAAKAQKHQVSIKLQKKFGEKFDVVLF